MFDTLAISVSKSLIHERFLSGLNASILFFATFSISIFNFLKPIWLIRMEIVQQLSPSLQYPRRYANRGSRVGVFEPSEREFCGYLSKLSS